MDEALNSMDIQYNSSAEESDYYTSDNTYESNSESGSETGSEDDLDGFHVEDPEEISILSCDHILAAIMTTYHQFLNKKADQELLMIHSHEFFDINCILEYHKILNMLEYLDEFLLFLSKNIGILADNIDLLEERFNNCPLFLAHLKTHTISYININWDSLSEDNKNHNIKYILRKDILTSFDNIHLHEYMSKKLTRSNSLIVCEKFISLEKNDLVDIYLPTTPIEISTKISIKLLLKLFYKKLVTYRTFTSILNDCDLENSSNSQILMNFVAVNKILFIDYLQSEKNLNGNKKTAILEGLIPLLNDGDIKFLIEKDCWPLLKMLPSKIDWNIILKRDDETAEEHILRIRNKKHMIQYFPTKISLTSDVICYITHDYFQEGEYCHSCINLHPVKLYSSFSLEGCGYCKQPIDRILHIIKLIYS